VRTARELAGQGRGAGRRSLIGILTTVGALALSGLALAPPAAAEVLTFTGTVTAPKATTHPFSVAAASRVTLSLAFTNTTADLNLGVRDSTGATVAFSGSKTANPEVLVADLEVAGSYDARVFGKTGGSDYTLTVDIAPLDAGAGAATFETVIGGTSRATIYPSGNDLGPDGTSYVADTGNDQVVAYSPAGAQLWRVGVRGSRAAGSFEDPRDVAYVGGFVYVADTGNQRIQKLNPATGASVQSWAVPGATPMGVSAGKDSLGNPAVLVANADKNSATVFTLTGTPLLTVAGVRGSGAGQLNQPRDAVTTAAGELLVVDYLNNRIARFSLSTGAWLGSFGSTGTGPTGLGHPYGIDLDDAGNVYVADSGNSRVSVFNPDFTPKVQYRLSALDAQQSEFVRRVAVGAGTNPLIYVSDLWGQRLMTVTQPAGTVGTVVPATLAPPGGYAEAGGVAIGNGVAMVVDTVNQRVNRYDPSTTPWTLTGSFGKRGWNNILDGFNWPRDITYSPTTNTFWLADTRNRRITEFTPAGLPKRTIGVNNPNGGGPFTWTSAIAIVGGDAIVAEQQTGRISRVNLAATTDLLHPVFVWRTPTGTVPGAYDVDVAAGVVYAVDTTAKRIVKLDAATGAVLGSFGQTVLSSPAAVTVSADGQIWVTERYHDRFDQFTPAGVLVRRVGTTGSGNVQFHSPSRILYDLGRLYVSDVYNDRVQVFDIPGLVP
jgi:DNA-binding beta-propeller fold protein YncE